ncbi:hypothetical protein SAMN05421747_11343 [Parapedobacter composti]|uniref:Outer membrane protein beta-barrel domain-containing protein n=1 Tax=Parapedobacter composti TaxID=623281 RepID=A0A1I1JT43_9SPHI|nr:hypothetical protein [Parapedobacter composti]SFC51817.1 hypothetical protein SAMN05421747_11343 [Parapedobacter composti]
MRHILLVATLCFGCLQLSAQVTRVDTVTYPTPAIPKQHKSNFNTDFGYTVAIRAYAYEQFPQLFNQSAEQPNRSSSFNGLLFKLNDNQISYRLQAAYFDDVVSLDNACEGCPPSMTGQLKNTAIKVGMEKNVNYSRFQPYFGADLGFMVQRFNTEGHGPVIAEDNRNALLFSPFIGAKVYIVPRVAIGAEANVNIAFTHQKTSNYYSEALAARTADQTKKYRWEYFFAPIAAITVQYNFGLLSQ